MEDYYMKKKLAGLFALSLIISSLVSSPADATGLYDLNP